MTFTQLNAYRDLFRLFRVSFGIRLQVEDGPRV